ncbi:MAG: hypothetical protein WAS54_07020 [Scrofimicrobium sp.]
MRFPLLTISKRELSTDPWAFLAPAIVAATCAVFTEAVVTFMLAAAADPETFGMGGATLSDNISGAILVAIFTAVPAIMVLAGTGDGAVTNMQGRIVRWKLAGASPTQITTVVVGQFVASCTVGALFSVIASLPVQSRLVKVMLEMAWVPDASAPTTLMSGVMTVVGCILVSLLGSLRPASKAGKVMAGPALREDEPQVKQHPILRTVLAVLLAISAGGLIAQAFGAQVGDDVSAGMNAVLFAPILIICAIASIGPWLIPIVEQWGRLVPSRFVAWHLALKTAGANPRRTSSTTLPFVIAASIAAIFSGLYATWDRALQSTDPDIALNYSDTIALFGPGIIIGLVGAAGSVFILSSAIAWLTSAMAARVLSASGVPAVALIDWRLQGLVIGTGLILVATIGVLAALRASRGNPRALLTSS